MTWVHLDDKFFEHPKTLAAGRDARDFYLAALCYCGANLTDGFVPSVAVRIIAARADVDDAHDAIKRLVAVELFDAAIDGWVVHNYLERNPSKSHVEEVSAKRIEAGRRGGKQKASNLLDRSQPNGKQTSSKLPSKNVADTDTDTDTDTKDNGGTDVPLAADAATAINAVPKRPSYSKDFEAFWAAYPSGRGSKKRSADVWSRLTLTAETRDEIMAGLAAWKACDQWRDPQFIKYAEVWLRDRNWEDEPPAGRSRASPNGSKPQRMGDVDWDEVRAQRKAATT